MVSSFPTAPWQVLTWSTLLAGTLTAVLARPLLGVFLLFLQRRCCFRPEELDDHRCPCGADATLARGEWASTAQRNEFA
jgi:hypothetical protein